LDLRSYGRAKLKDQRPNYCNTLSEYFEEIHTAIEIMKREGNTNIILSGQGTGK
jgi:hypothetical protein